MVTTPEQPEQIDLEAADTICNAIDSPHLHIVLSKKFAAHRRLGIEQGKRMAVPTAFREQACVIGKTESIVSIYCDDADDALKIFDWLVALPEQQEEG